MDLRVKWILLFLALTTVYLPADDGAASIAAGGIIMMKREPRITMAREVLRISVRNVVVDYDFRNDSNQNITTTVAFPVPMYPEDEARIDGPVFFDDFKLWINGSPAIYKIEASAFLNDKEYTQLLNEMHVNIATLGITNSNDSEPVDANRLPADQRKQLVDLGLIEKENGETRWKVKKKYYWQQTFPAHKIVHIRHEYTPATGGYATGLLSGIRDQDSSNANDLMSFCIEGRLKTILQQAAKDDKSIDTGYAYVDFILTTANTWKTPIEDFTLIVEHANREGAYTSFCWDGPVTKIDATHFSAHRHNFIPIKELRVGWFHLLKAGTDR